MSIDRLVQAQYSNHRICFYPVAPSLPPPALNDSCNETDIIGFKFIF